jgi:hypothetical protein
MKVQEKIRSIRESREEMANMSININDYLKIQRREENFPISKLQQRGHL